MKQIFVLVPNPARAQLIRRLVEAAGAHAHLSDGALPALTELERTPADAVICAEDAGDMSGEDFRNILRFEPATRDTPVYLLTAQAGEQHTEPPNYDLPPETGTVALVRQVLSDLGVDPSPALPCDDSPGDLHGGVGDPGAGGLGLPELLSWVAAMELDGHWLIDTGAGQEGYLLMQGGDVAYAEFGEYSGRQALLELLDLAEQDSGSHFRFCRAELPPDLAEPDARNIEERTERLLMEVAVDLDHRHAERDALL
ncbi:DUF4388 domain-containing protein [Deinococcus sp. Marseille-Q6407]|uniref:DUF4388 domain-containing protein n=1 Tax=Deinococcus sp. Marseille-Q6407 TaxID=2969223 RepID=UPI0021C07A37|nr:DUF4388 domain-containing protein [Deinococcus sp. Marseille-Q6407]